MDVDADFLYDNVLGSVQIQFCRCSPLAAGAEQYCLFPSRIPKCGRMSSLNHITTRRLPSCHYITSLVPLPPPPKISPSRFPLPLPLPLLSSSSPLVGSRPLGGTAVPLACLSKPTPSLSLTPSALSAAPTPNNTRTKQWCFPSFAPPRRSQPPRMQASPPRAAT